MQRDAQSARDVIVASSRRSQPVWRVRHERVAGSAGKHAQGFECGGHVDPFQTVVAMLSLGEQLYQSLRLQPLQVHASGRRGYLSDHGKLGAGSRTAVGKAVEHAGACGLTDGRGNCGGSFVVLDIHSLMVNEVLMVQQVAYWRTCNPQSRQPRRSAAAKLLEVSRRRLWP